MPRRLALLCGAGRFPLTLFMGQIVFVKLFAPVSLQAPAASWPWRGSDLRADRREARKGYKGTGPLGDFRSRSRRASSESKIVALFYLILKIGCATVWWRFLPPRLLELAFSCHCTTRGSSPLYTSTCVPGTLRLVPLQFFLPEAPYT